MKIKICIEPACQNTSSTKGYCRLHYLKNWKTLKENEQKKAAERLNRYVDGICKKNPDKSTEAIRRDIRSDKGQYQQFLDDPAGSEEDLAGALSYQDDEAIDKLLSHIKVDKDY